MEDILTTAQADNVRLSDDGTAVIILDQTQLPNRTVFLTLRTPEDLFDAIRTLKVRGAPAIGICAGYALYVAAQQLTASSFDAFLTQLATQADYLNQSRPTAVNLSWALKRMLRTARESESIAQALTRMRTECHRIQQEDIDMCRRI